MTEKTTDGLSPPGSPFSLGDATERAINLGLYRRGVLDARFLPEAERRWLEKNAKEAANGKRP